MDIIAAETPYVTGRSHAQGGAGDSAILTALGVFHAMRACVAYRWRETTLRGKRVGVAGAGKVGRHLVTHLLHDGASVTIADPDVHAAQQLRLRHPEVDVVSPEALIDQDLDIYAPCALGGVLSERTVPRLHTQIVCGAANNQLAHAGVDTQLAERDILYAPDYVANAGGLIQVEDERHGYSEARATQRARCIADTMLRVFELAERDGITPAAAADRWAEQRMLSPEASSSIWLPAT
jgi:valine dehydrogenase (NAD+)